MKKTTNQIFLATALSLSLVAVGCTANEINAGVGIATNLFKGATITNDQLAAQARLSAQAMDGKQKLASSRSKYTRRLNKITKNLQKVDGLTLNYKVYLSNTINAFAMPDGSVRVYSGLMDIMNDDELLAVIGHEIAHVKYQHSLSQYRKAYLAKAATMGLASYGSGVTAALAGSYGDIGVAFMDAQFSQRDELAADAYGVQLLHKLGRDIYAAASSQRKLLEKAGASGGGLFSSHPPSSTRIKKTTEAADKLSQQ